MNEPVGRFTTAKTINRGFGVAPALSKGIGVTFVLAVVGSLARVVIPVTIQQTIDKGLRPGDVRIGFIVQMAIVAAICVMIASVALRQAVFRLGVGAENGLY
ncbi:MAG: hypothetical protein ACKOEH_02235, partial [Actinomycetota bacterium]